MIKWVAILALLSMTACGSDRTTVDVFAAASLTDAFGELESRFEEAHPDIDVRMIVAGSDILRRQIDDGADADVFAPADISLFDSLTVNGIVVEPIVYASNEIVLVANTDSFEPGQDIFDWDRDGVVVARCDSGVPCGAATDRLLEVHQIRLGVVTYETDVRAVLTKVRLGEADAGFVYTTDRLAAGDDVTALDLRDSSASVRLAVAALSSRSEAQLFVDFVLSDEAASILASFGFAEP